MQSLRSEYNRIGGFPMSVFIAINKLLDPKIKDVQEAILEGRFTTIEEYRAALGRYSAFKEVKEILTDVSNQTESEDFYE
jgi:hypothetical protein